MSTKNNDNTFTSTFSTGYKYMFNNKDYAFYTVLSFILPLIITIYIIFKNNIYSKGPYIIAGVSLISYLFFLFIWLMIFAYIVGILNDEIILNGTKKATNKSSYGYTITIVLVISIILIKILSLIFSNLIGSSSIITLIFIMIDNLFAFASYFVFVMFNSNKFIAFS